MKSFQNNIKTSVIIAAAGKGLRAGFNKNKLLVNLDSSPPLLTTVKAFDIDLINEIVVSVNADDKEEITQLLKNINKKIILCNGGDTRFDSVKYALEMVSGDIVLIHDGARPYVSENLIKSCIESVKIYGSGICAVPSTDTICIEEDGMISEIADREKLFNIQTPQGFFTNEIKEAYSKASGTFTDDSSVFLKYKDKPFICRGESDNIKLTFKKDFIKSMNYYTGIGFDTHRLVKERKMILGGVEIESDLGLLGHSDADVLTHAIMNALLSSAGLRDIGYHFSDTDDKYKDISSMLLLEKVIAMISAKGYGIKNISAVIIAEKPKLSPYIDKIINNLAKVMHISTECVGITATTNEKLGYIGRSEGISVTASVLTFK
jgi:2-C-methyl-D-erythritol 2,4-cyclodiphosphate synthase/2-C-methyl-D-erythritol 4-phosphate cytidylyltransferase